MTETELQERAFDDLWIPTLMATPMARFEARLVRIERALGQVVLIHNKRVRGIQAMQQQKIIDELREKLRQYEIDERAKAWFVSKKARNQAYGAAVGLAFVAFLIGTLVG